MTTFPCDHIWPPLPLSYITLIIITVLGFVVVTDNILFLAAIIKDPYNNFRSPFMYILMNSAVSDCLFGFISTPAMIFVLIMEIHRHKRKFNTSVVIVHLLYYLSIQLYFFSQVRQKGMHTFHNSLPA